MHTDDRTPMRETPTQETPGPAGPPSAAGLPKRVMMAFTAPVQLGEELRDQAPWFWTLTIVAVVATAAMLLVPGDVWRQAAEAQMAGQPQQEGGPSTEQMVQFARWGGAIFALGATFVGTLVVAGVMYLLFNVGFGLDARYKVHLSAASHTAWIGLAGLLLTLPIWISKQDMQISLGLGLLLTESPSSFFGHFLNRITLFGLWASAALAAVEVGLARGRVSLGKAISGVMACYLVWVLLQAGGSAVFGP